MPLPSARSPDLIDMYRPVDAQLRELRLAPQRLIEWTERLRGLQLSRLPRYPELEHRLSPHMLARSPDDRLEPRTPDELSSLPAASKLLRRALAEDPTSFPDAIVKIHELCCSSNTGLRRGGVVSQPDRLGTYVVFPEPFVVRPELERLHGFLNEAASLNAAFRAAVAMTLICNIHPFSDGNGRLSRLVFNSLVCTEHAAAPYIPLHELGRLSRGGFLIAMRLAQYHGDWTALARFLANAIDTLRKIDGR